MKRPLSPQRPEAAAGHDGGAQNGKRSRGGGDSSDDSSEEDDDDVKDEPMEVKEENGINDNRENGDFPPSPVQPHHQDYPPLADFTPEYVSLLQTIQERISNPLETDNLERVIETIQKTGCFALSSDNCSLSS